MLDGLRAYLTAEEFYWLAACAVYPAISWQLTLNLGQGLRTSNGGRLLDADRLLVLACRGFGTPSCPTGFAFVSSTS